MAFLYWKAYWGLEGFFTFLNTMVLVEDIKSRIKELKWLCSYSVVCREMNGRLQSPTDCHRVSLQELHLCVWPCPGSHRAEWCKALKALGTMFHLEEVSVCYGAHKITEFN